MPLPISTTAFDKLAKRYLKGEPRPGDDALIVDVFDAYQALADGVKEDLAAIGFGGAVTRTKSSGTLFDKMRRHPTLAASRINDIGGARLLVKPMAFRKGQKFTSGLTLPEEIMMSAGRWTQRSTVNKIVNELGGARSARQPHVEDRCNEGKDSFGYRAVHVVVYPDGVPIEIQVRTPLQHQWAEISERLGDRWGRGLRYAQEFEGADIEVTENVTRGMVIEMLRKLSNLVNVYELGVFASESRLLRACLRGDSVGRAAAMDDRERLNSAYEPIRDTLESLGQVFGVESG